MNAPAHTNPPVPLAGAIFDVDGPATGAELWERETEVLLDHVGLAPGATCLDLGRGVGALGPLSRRAGPGGRVTHVAYDGAPVAAAGRRVLDPVLPNVEVVEADALAGWPAASFDLVHARFLLAPAGRDHEALRTMARLARPGGAVAVQEPDATFWRCYPARPAWDRLTAAIGATLARDGADLRAGQRLYRLFHRAGLEDVGLRAAVVALHDAHPAMRLPILLAEALRDHILGAGLMAEVELDGALRECEQCALDPHTFVTTFLVTQVWGRKPAA